MIQVAVRLLAVAMGGPVLGCDAGPAGPPLTGAEAIAVGGEHACALLADGTATCWGDNAFEQLGVNDLNQPLELNPVAVDGLTGIKALAAGRYHTCALMNDGSVDCWGGNVDAQVGNGSQIAMIPGAEADQLFVLPPAAVAGLSGPATVLAAEADGSDGSGGYTCAVMADQTMQCWGAAEIVQGDIATPPTTVSGVSQVMGMALGRFHACTLATDGTVSCWGVEATGQSGTPYEAAPTLVAGLSSVVQIAAGSLHACALSSAGTVQCWGTGAAVGTGTFAGSPTPVDVPGLTGVTAIAAGGYQTCALLNDQTVRCWGTWGYGENQSADISAPREVAHVAGAIAISVGGTTACALSADGTVHCWGDNSWGALGKGSGAPNDLLTASTVLAPRTN